MRRMNRAYALLLTSSFLLAAGCLGKTIDGGSGMNGNKLKNTEAADDGSQVGSDNTDASTPNWSLMAPLPFARTDHSVATVGGKIYVMGGYTGSMLKRVDMYDPATNTWTQRADMLTPRRDFATAVIDGKIYVTGGMSFTDPNALTYLDTTEVYDPSTDTWSSLAPCPIGTPYNSVWGNLFVGGTAFMGRFYVVVFNANATPTTSMHVYDPQTNVWTAEETPTPSFFESAQIEMATIGDTLYLFASYYGPGEMGTGVWAWNAEAHLWTIIQPVPEVWRSAYLASGGKLYAIGGVVGDSSRYDATNLIYEYDPVLERWAQRGSINVAREYPAAAEVDGNVYVIGGDVPVYGAGAYPASAAVERGTFAP